MDILKRLEDLHPSISIYNGGPDVYVKQRKNRLTSRAEENLYFKVGKYFSKDLDSHLCD